MNAAHQASRRRRPLLIVLSVALVIALVIAAILWRDRFGDGQQEAEDLAAALPEGDFADEADVAEHQRIDRKSTRLNSSHVAISYAVCCLKKKTQKEQIGHLRAKVENR